MYISDDNVKNFENSGTQYKPFYFWLQRQDALFKIDEHT